MKNVAASDNVWIDSKIKRIDTKRYGSDAHMPRLSISLSA